VLALAPDPPPPLTTIIWLMSMAPKIVRIVAPSLDHLPDASFGLRTILPSEARLPDEWHRRIPAMTHVHPKPMPNWCPQVNPGEAWTARCVKEKIAADGKRHRCQKKVGHDDNVHTCKCGLEWKQW